MKKLLAGFTVFVILMIATVVGVLMWQRNKTANSKAVVVIEHGIVSYKIGDEQYQDIIGTEREITTGTQLKTGADSYARVFFPDNSLMSIDANSEVKVDYAAGKIDIEQLVGNTWHRVQSLAAGGSYEVRTPDTIAAVRGTIFGVGNVVGETPYTDVFVEESSVDVSRFELKDGKRNILEKLELKVGERVRSIRDSKSFRFERLQLDDKLKLSLWYKRNKLVDQEFTGLRGRLIGQNLRDDLRKAIASKVDAVDLRLGDADATSPIGKDSLAALDKLLNINENTCQQFTLREIQSNIDVLRKYRNFVENADGLEKILVGLYRSCEDGKFSVDEAANLQQLIQSFNSARQ